MNDQAASALGNISPADQFWYWLAAMAIVCLIGIATAKVIDGWRWWRDRPRDGQGGVPPIARRLRDAEAPTQAISMRDITAMERVTPCPQFCDDVARVGDPGACGCPAPCRRAWCPKRRSAVPVTWTEREEGVR